MLRQLSIRDVVLIDRLELEFEPGLGVLTGETGAGKSILLDGLGLALGTRADTGLVRAGETQAIVAAEFELPADHPAFALLAEQGIESEPGEPLLVRRTRALRVWCASSVMGPVNVRTSADGLTLPPVRRGSVTPSVV